MQHPKARNSGQVLSTEVFWLSTDVVPLWKVIVCIPEVREIMLGQPTNCVDITYPQGSRFRGLCGIVLDLEHLVRARRLSGLLGSL